MPEPPSTPDPGDDPRLRARADLLWYLRHADALRRWPVIAEEWARTVEDRRLGPAGPEGAGNRGDSAQ